jgi:glutamate-1-semialdehyde 2,1-aminomutase
VRDWASAKRASPARYAEFFRAMLAEGVYLAPSQYEAGFLSTVHDAAVLTQTIEAAQRAFSRLRLSA